MHITDCKRRKASAQACVQLNPFKPIATMPNLNFLALQTSRRDHLAYVQQESGRMPSFGKHTRDQNQTTHSPLSTDEMTNRGLPSLDTLDSRIKERVTTSLIFMPFGKWNDTPQLAGIDIQGLRLEVRDKVLVGILSQGGLISHLLAVTCEAWEFNGFYTRHLMYNTSPKKEFFYLLCKREWGVTQAHMELTSRCVTRGHEIARSDPSTHHFHLWKQANKWQMTIPKFH